MSSNAMAAIRRTLENSGVAHCFAHVFSGDVEPDKAVSIRRILGDPSYTSIRRCSPAYVEDGPLPAAATRRRGRPGDRHRRGRPGGRLVRDPRRSGSRGGCTPRPTCWPPAPSSSRSWPQEIVARLLPDGSCTPGGCDCLTSACALPQVPPHPVASGNQRPITGGLPDARVGRDVRGEAAAAAALRRARRQPPAPAVTSAGCGCGVHREVRRRPLSLRRARHHRGGAAVAPGTGTYVSFQ